MKLKDKTIYKDGRGIEHVIMGVTKHHCDYVWSLQGDWYMRETGAKLAYRIIRDAKGHDVGGEHYALDTDSWHTLVEEVGAYE